MKVERSHEAAPRQEGRIRPKYSMGCGATLTTEGGSNPPCLASWAVWGRLRHSTSSLN